MRRLGLPEIEDSPACPDWMRDAMTGFLQVVIEQTQPYATTGEILDGLLADAQSKTVVDLGSGAGGPWPTLVGSLRPGTSVVLTDLYPNQNVAARVTGTPGLTYHSDSVSALNVPPELAGLRTMFTSLHHFSPAEVREILKNAQDAGVPFAAFEATHRSVPGVFVTLFVPLLVLVFMLRVRPRRFLTLFFTYLIPILPLVIWWDGFASATKTYTTDELTSMAQDISAPGYEWRAEELKVPGAPIPVTVLTGRPLG